MLSTMLMLGAALVAESAAPASESAAPASESAAPAAESAAPAAESAAPAAESAAPGSLKITSERSDYDNKAGVAMFDGNVALDATIRGERYTMNSAQMFVFFDGTNDIKRVVAIGDVAVTNGFRTGSCAKATFLKASNRVTMYGGDDGTPAVLASADPKQKGDLSGRRIRFWLDSEQIEVEGSSVSIDMDRIEKGGGFKDILKK